MTTIDYLDRITSTCPTNMAIPTWPLDMVTTASGTYGDNRLVFPYDPNLDMDKAKENLEKPLYKPTNNSIRRVEAWFTNETLSLQFLDKLKNRACDLGIVTVYDMCTIKGVQETTEDMKDYGWSLDDFNYVGKYADLKAGYYKLIFPPARVICKSGNYSKNKGENDMDLNNPLVIRCCTSLSNDKTDRAVNIPKVAKVDVYNERTVKVTFIDGSFTRSVCSKDDIFNLDVGITICLMKKLLGKDGHKAYNDLIRDVHKVMEKDEEERLKKKEYDEKKLKKQKKAAMKRAAKKLKAKEEAIDIQAQGMIRAMQHIDKQRWESELN